MIWLEALFALIFVGAWAYVAHVIMCTADDWEDFEEWIPEEDDDE